MAVFKNTTNHILKIVVDGVRKNINPGQVIHGPESLTAIPGLELINNKKKTIIINKNKQTEPIVETPAYQENISSGSSDYTDQINDILKYLYYMKSLNRIPSVTVAILTKNSEKLIKECCESILNQVKYRPLTIMICDTGTTENNVLSYYKILESKCNNKNITFKIHYLKNYQFSDNYNEASKLVETEYFLIQNNDTVALNDYITEMMYTAVLPKVGSVGPRMLYPDGRIQHDGQFIFQPNGLHVPGTAGHLHLGIRPEQLPHSEHKTILVDGNTAAGVLMRTEDFKQINGFDVNYKDIFQDVDLMIKVQNDLNKYNYCNRFARIIHIDNATRMGSAKDPSRFQKMRDDTFYLNQKCDQFGWRKKYPKQVDFSIITLVYNYESYREFLISLRNQIGNHTVEIIAIPNFNKQFDSVYKAYNSAIDVANGKLLVFTHDDIVVTNNFLNSITNNVITLNRSGIPWGVLGSAGIFLDSPESAFYLLDSDMKKSNIAMNVADKVNYVEVAALDELCFILDSKNNLRFNDSKFTGYHFYGIDICTTARMAGLKNYAINAYCHHKSDGMKNLASDEKFQQYLDCATKFFRHAQSLGITKWRSTTARAVDDKLIIFSVPQHIKDRLGKEYLIYEIKN